MTDVRTARTLVLLSLVLALGATSTRADEFRIVKGLQFSEAVPALTLDLYLPAASDRSVPCVIVIQGGGFSPQDGQKFRPFAEHLARSGFAAALISYRGRPEHHHRETLADVKSSVRYIRHVSEVHGIDPTRIGAMGRSAGGTLAALLAVTADEADPDSRIQAAVCFAGVFDFISRFTDAEQLALQPNHESKLKTNGEWIGTPFSTTDLDWRAASAVTHVDANDPPILFLHARDDSTVPWLQSRNMHRVMTGAGVDCELQVYDTGGHAVQPPDVNTLDEMVTFFRRHL